MYKVYADDILIYNDVTPELETTKLLSPRLSLSDNSAGSFNATLPEGNAAYSTIAPITTTIRITRDDRWLWTGRVLTVSKDFWNQKTIECEGALAFLNDSVLPLVKYGNRTLPQLVSTILAAHNAKVPASRRIQIGSIAETSASGEAIGTKDYYFEGQTSLEVLQTQVDDWAFHFRMREDNGTLKLDILKTDQLDTTNQTINFGQNLLDYSSTDDWSSLVTCILPLGAQLDTINTTGSEDYPDRVTIKSVNNNDLYLQNANAVNKYGRIEEVLDWSEVDDPATLKKLAQLYLNDIQYKELSLSVTVLDLHYLDADVEAFKFLSQVHVSSKPHNLEETFLITQMDIPFDQPENTTFTFERSNAGYYGSDRNGSAARKGTISAASSQIVPRDGILKTAKENATSMISMATNGFVTLKPSETDPSRIAELIISNMSDPDKSTRKWTWNVNGLMHQTRSSASASWGTANIAITMDGQIVADMITTGILRGGTGSNVSEWNLNDGTIKIISGGTGTAARLTSGILEISSGNVSVGSSIQLRAGDGYYRWNGVDTGHIGANNLRGQPSVSGLELGVDNGSFISIGRNENGNYESKLMYVSKFFRNSADHPFYEDCFYINSDIYLESDDTVNVFNLKPGWYYGEYADPQSEYALDADIDIQPGTLTFRNGIGYVFTQSEESGYSGNVDLDAERYIRFANGFAVGVERKEQT